jgi:hypothetical protein
MPACYTGFWVMKVVWVRTLKIPAAVIDSSSQQSSPFCKDKTSITMYRKSIIPGPLSLSYGGQYTNKVQFSMAFSWDGSQSEDKYTLINNYKRLINSMINKCMSTINKAEIFKSVMIHSVSNSIVINKVIIRTLIYSFQQCVLLSL